MTSRLRGVMQFSSLHACSCFGRFSPLYHDNDSKLLVCVLLIFCGSGFEVNFMDDVGQTLLNWASAFGTQEMVEFLCERDADVNRGQRSSSLHYAACFGRPKIVKTLLQVRKE